LFKYLSVTDEDAAALTSGSMTKMANVLAALIYTVDTVANGVLATVYTIVNVGEILATIAGVMPQFPMSLKTLRLSLGA
jgi:hypothetical protein